MRALLADDACLWVDLAEPHHARAPEQMPVTTHLWGWRGGRWVRVRIDSGRALATVFTEGGTVGEPASADLADGVPWGKHDRAADWEPTVRLFTTRGAGALTFARVG